MTAGELIEILKALPEDMPVVMGVDEDLEDICMVGSNKVKIKITETDEEEVLFVLVPCYCDLDFEDEDYEEMGGEDEEENYINSRPELN